MSGAHYSTIELSKYPHDIASTTRRAIRLFIQEIQWQENHVYVYAVHVSHGRYIHHVHVLANIQAYHLLLVCTHPLYVIVVCYMYVGGMNQ